jgi:antirestriction protein
MVNEKQICIQTYTNHASKWISIEQEIQDIYKDINNFLKENSCEEWFIADCENLPFNPEDCDIEGLLSDIELIENSAYEADLIIHIANEYTKNKNIQEAIEFLEDNYQGEFKDNYDFAYELLEATCALEHMPQNLKSYFDYEAYAYHLLASDYEEFRGHYYTTV